MAALMGGLSRPLAAAAAERTLGEVQRVAALDWALAATLLGIGITPVAIADVAGYREKVGDPALPDGVVDLGPYWEPNLEVLQRSRPELILRASWQAATRTLLERIAPTAVFDIYSRNGPPLANSRAVALAMAEATGRDAAGAAFVARADSAMAAARGSLRDFRRPVYLVDLNQDGRNAWILGPNGLTHEVLLSIGLKNAWEGQTNSFGFASIGIEQLGSSPEACLLYLDSGPRTAIALARLQRSPLWTQLPFVRAGRVRPVPVFYTNGGLATAIRFSELATKSLSELRDG